MVDRINHKPRDCKTGRHIQRSGGYLVDRKLQRWGLFVAVPEPYNPMEAGVHLIIATGYRSGKMRRAVQKYLPQ